MAEQEEMNELLAEIRVLTPDDPLRNEGQRPLPRVRNTDDAAAKLANAVTVANRRRSRRAREAKCLNKQATRVAFFVVFVLVLADTAVIAPLIWRWAPVGRSSGCSSEGCSVGPRRPSASLPVTLRTAFHPVAGRRSPALSPQCR